MLTTELDEPHRHRRTLGCCRRSRRRRTARNRAGSWWPTPTGPPPSWPAASTSSTRALTPGAGQRADDRAPPARQRVRQHRRLQPRRDGRRPRRSASATHPCANQSFTLKKKPLTYLSAAIGRRPERRPQHADGVGRRRRVARGAELLRRRRATATVYIVRQDDAGDSTVTFGDGVRGARLPSGASVVGRYRFGAGAASPPAGGLTSWPSRSRASPPSSTRWPAAGGADARRRRRCAPSRRGRRCCSAGRCRSPTSRRSPPVSLACGPCRRVGRGMRRCSNR